VKNYVHKANIHDALGVFLPGSSDSLLSQKPTFPNSNSTRIEDPHGNQLRLMGLPL